MVKRMETISKMVDRTDSRVQTMSQVLMHQVRNEVHSAVNQSQLDAGQKSASLVRSVRKKRVTIKQRVGTKSQWNLLSVGLFSFLTSGIFKLS